MNEHVEQKSEPVTNRDMENSKANVGRRGREKWVLFELMVEVLEILDAYSPSTCFLTTFLTSKYLCSGTLNPNFSTRSSKYPNNISSVIPPTL